MDEEEGGRGQEGIIGERAEEGKGGERRGRYAGERKGESAELKEDRLVGKWKMNCNMAGT